MLEITGTAGNVSGTIQPVASNDDAEPASAKNWILYSNTISASSAYLTALASATLTGNFKYYGAYLTAISGTGAVANVKMSA
jgi:hypothetical protein